MYGISAFAQSPYASLGGAFYGVIVNETETLTDTQTAIAAFLAAQTDTQTLTDAQTGLAAFLVAQDQTQTLTDSSSAVQNFPVTESASAVTLSALEDVIAGFVGAQANTITLTDDQVGGFQYIVDIVEPQTLTDTNVSQFAFLGVTSDVLVITTIDAVLAQFNVVNIDSLVTLSDFQYARGWFKINDNQTVTWAAVNNNQTQSWTPVNDNQNPNWVEINDNQ
jgi:hypothetical protein